MKKIQKSFYQIISSIAFLVSSLSQVQLYSFGIMIGYQPDVAEKLKKRSAIGRVK
ncbi:MAG: hypothetical protein HFI75_03365 [Lachnospiraceae bacterium]|nr:hypothetical protein [Lachnospiraceae bacterium]